MDFWNLIPEQIASRVNSSPSLALLRRELSRQGEMGKVPSEVDKYSTCNWTGFFPVVGEMARCFPGLWRLQGLGIWDKLRRKPIPSEISTPPVIPSFDTIKSDAP